MSTTQSGGFTIKRVTLAEKGFRYATFKVSGWLNGQRVRKQFKSREEAVGAVNSLQVESANNEGRLRAVGTRLNDNQVREAESAYTQIGDRSLTAVVHWYLANYRPPIEVRSVEAARDSFFADRVLHISEVAMND